ncbi:sensor histidine kinase [Embleya sp. NPDC001921]
MVSLLGQAWSSSTESGVWGLARVAVLLVLVGACARWEPRRSAGGAIGAMGAAVALWSLPLAEWRGGPLEAFGAAVFWGLPVVVAVVLGGYPRLVERRRVAAVVSARREQQLDIARDLHDYVAHDVSGIVAQAQAARFVGASDPAQALVALERIERAGLAALASMDRMVTTLHVGDSDRAASRVALPGIDRLPELIADFTTSAGTRAVLTIAPELTTAADVATTADPNSDAPVTVVSRETSATVHRVVVEALTNVRRHAPNAVGVDVAVTASSRFGRPAVAVLVVDDNDATGPGAAGAHNLARRRTGGGHGLAGLRERVREAGGELHAGPLEHGWRVHAILPADRADRAPHSADPPHPEPKAATARSTRETRNR